MWTITSGFKRFMLRLFLLFVFLAIFHVAVDAVFTWQLKSTINKLKTEGKLKLIEEIIPPVDDLIALKKLRNSPKDREDIKYLKAIKKHYEL